jgi:tRNA (cytidine/uridine-2'-O-)-methyltransferase
VVENWAELQGRLAEIFANGRAWLFTKTAEREYTEVAYQREDVLVFGCETRGLPAEILAAQSEQTVRIPIRPQVRSLNLSNAAAVAMYEAVRQIGAS